MTDIAHFDRRAMLAGLATLLGVAALPDAALAAPVRKGRFLPRAQFALLAAVVDTILPTTDTPGALEAKVDARLDAMLRDWASPATRAEIGAALARIDAAARMAKGRAFAALAPQERADVLRDHDKAALKAAPPADGSKPKMFDLLAAPSDPGYKRLKELVVALYYYSPVGSANELTYEHVPGAFEPSIKLTPASRPYLGLGPV
ncbi:MAG: gluconate 2-dehydrogenase subunit 3 family protein [Novosphingobium sp.]